MKVCIAEKPSVAREIASVLGANTKHDGYYEGNGYAGNLHFWAFMYLERTERLQTALEKLGFEQPAHASREI